MRTTPTLWHSIPFAKDAISGYIESSKIGKRGKKLPFQTIDE